jgi:hypothetical protein
MTKQQRSPAWIATFRAGMRKALLYAQRHTTFRDWIMLAVLVALLLPLGFYLGLYQFQNNKIATLRQQLAPPNVAPTHQPAIKKPLRNTPFTAGEYTKATLKTALLSIEEKALAHKLIPLDGTEGIALDPNKTPENPSEKITAYHIVISAVGSYANIGEFLFSLYDLPIVTVLNDVSLRPKPDSQLTILEAKVTLYLYGDAAQ